MVTTGAARTGRIRLGEGQIWPEEPAAAAMAEKVGRGRDWRRADGDEEAATAVGVKDPRLLLLEDEGAARIRRDGRRTGQRDGGRRRWRGRDGRTGRGPRQRPQRADGRADGERAAAAAVMTLREGVKNGFGARGLPPPGARRAPRGSAAAMRRVVAGSHLSSVTMLQMKESGLCVY